METIVKQRVIGAVVLVALAVIFIPALLEGPEEEPLPESLTIPPELRNLRKGEIQPLDQKFAESADNQAQVVEQPGDEESQEPESVTLEIPPLPAQNATDRAGQLAESAPLESATTEEPAVGQTDAADGKIPQPEVPPVVADPVVEATPVIPGATPGQAPAPPSSPQVGETQSETATVQAGWVVQVGAFSKETNARAVRDGLRKAGYPAFIEKLSRSSGMLYRVRVGPEIERSGATALEQKLATETGQKGKVMRHP